MRTIKRIDPSSAGRIFGAMYFVLGLVFVPLMAVPMLLSKESAGLGLGLGFLLAAPFLYGAMAFIGTYLLALLYNLLAARFGGLRVEVVDIA